MFDVDADGFINFNDSARFNELSKHLDLPSVDETQRNAWEEFEDKLDTSYIGSLKKQVSELYLRIHSSADGSLLQQYESLVRSLAAESKGRVLQNLKLESSLIRAEERRDHHWTELQKELQLQMYHREITEQQRLEAMVMSMQRIHDSEVMELQAVAQILMKENAKLKRSLTHQPNLSQGESNTLRMLREYQGHSTSVQIARGPRKHMNILSTKTLGSGNRGVSTRNESHIGLRKPLQRLHFKWAANYLDDGDSTSVADTSNSEYDSYNSEDLESLHLHNIHVTSKMSPRKLEGFGSVGPSTSALSSRKRLLTFPSKDDATDPTYKLVLAGDAGSGKSSFLLRISRHEFRGETQSISTVGAECKVKSMLVDGENTTLQIWDTAGQERFRSITKSYFRSAHGVLLLYDITCESTFLHIGQWMDQIQESTDGPIPICVIGNKADRRSELPEGSCVSRVRGERLAMTYNTLFCETSAKEGTNIIEAVLHLAREVKKNPQSKSTYGSQLLPNQEWTQTNCCGM